MDINSECVFDRFGFNLPEENSKERSQAKLLSDFQEWDYNSSTSDWENTKTDEVLTGYEIPSHLSALLTNNINDSIS